jgi:hypothetical protein
MAEYFVDENGFVSKIPPTEEPKKPSALPEGETATPPGKIQPAVKRTGIPVMARRESKPPPRAKSGTICPVCGAETQRFVEHMRQEHPGDQRGLAIKPEFARCPKCKRLIPRDKIAYHKANECPLRNKNQAARKKEAGSAKRTPRRHEIKPHRAAGGKEKPTVPGHSWTRSKARRSAPTMPKVDVARESTDREALIQSFDERIDGGKYMGYMSHESGGQYGSLPLYDDYEDESGPD